MPITQLVSFYLQLDMHFYSSAYDWAWRQKTLDHDFHPYLHIRVIWGTLKIMMIGQHPK